MIEFVSIGCKSGYGLMRNPLLSAVLSDITIAGITLDRLFRAYDFAKALLDVEEQAADMVFQLSFVRSLIVEFRCHFYVPPGF